MRPVAVRKQPFLQSHPLMVLDDAEMALELIDLAKTTNLQDSRRAPAPPTLSPEWLTELYSAASMIMDRDECVAMAKEIAVAQQHHHVAA